MVERCPIREQFTAAAEGGLKCRIVYRDTLGEHHAVFAVPVEWRLIEGEEWDFFESEIGEMHEIRHDDIVALEVPEGSRSASP